MTTQTHVPATRGDERNPTLLPFHGLRFAPHLPGGLANLIGPPADIEDSDEAHAYVRDRELNAVRLEIEDDGDELRFDTARELLRRWRADGTLVEDHTPSYYVYDQSFDDLGVRRTRRGVFGLVPIDAPDVCVMAHEETWEDNRQRRLQLLRELDASISPIFLVYESPEIQASLVAMTERGPDAKATDELGNVHRLWRISSPSEVERMRQTMQGRQYYIADGHHRYEAARAFHAEAQRADTGLILACCVESTDPGIVIRPIHRLLHTRGAEDWIAARDTLKRWFEVSSAPVGDRDGPALLRALPGDDQPVAGIITDHGDTFVTLRQRTREPRGHETMDDAHPADRLDVSVITDLLIGQALGIKPGQEEASISYVNDSDDVLAALKAGSAGIGILLRPVRLSQVLAVARANGRIPAKSTSFVPKVPIGLVMHAFGGSRFEVRGSSHDDRDRSSPASLTAKCESSSNLEPRTSNRQ